MIFRTGTASGFEIAFLILAVLLLAAPFDKHVLGGWDWAREAGLPTGRMASFLLAAAILLCIPGLRRQCAALLRKPIPGERLEEPAIAIGVNLVAVLGAFGLFALWNWSIGGEPTLARQMGQVESHASQWARAISIGGLVHLLLAVLVAPVIEELVFRGLLYPAWERQWGWVASTLGTSVVFGLFHGAFLPQFLASIVFICALRRTGSLWAPILAHAANNALLWYPLLGQFVLPEGRSTGELHLWWPQLACLAVIAVALPSYLFMSRDAKVPRGQ